MPSIKSLALTAAVALVAVFVYQRFAVRWGAPSLVA